VGTFTLAERARDVARDVQRIGERGDLEHAALVDDLPADVAIEEDAADAVTVRAAPTVAARA
jgi:hypothetical protein